MATSLVIAQTAAAAAGLEAPSTLNSGDGLQVLALLNRAGTDLTEKRGIWGQSWPMLTKQLTLELIANQEYYPLPAAYRGLVLDTIWDVQDRDPAVGPASPAEWATLKGSVVGSASSARYYRVVANPTSMSLSIEMHPVPEDSSEITLDYLSDLWVRPWTSTGSHTVPPEWCIAGVM